MKFAVTWCYSTTYSTLFTSAVAWSQHAFSCYPCIQGNIYTKIHNTIWYPYMIPSDSKCNMNKYNMLVFRTPIPGHRFKQNNTSTGLQKGRVQSEHLPPWNEVQWLPATRRSQKNQRCLHDFLIRDFGLGDKKSHCGLPKSLVVGIVTYRFFWNVLDRNKTLLIISNKIQKHWGTATKISNNTQWCGKQTKNGWKLRAIPLLQWDSVAIILQQTYSLIKEKTQGVIHVHFHYS